MMARMVHGSEKEGQDSRWVAVKAIPSAGSVTRGSSHWLHQVVHPRRGFHGRSHQLTGIPYQASWPPRESHSPLVHPQITLLSGSNPNPKSPGPNGATLNVTGTTMSSCTAARGGVPNAQDAEKERLGQLHFVQRTEAKHHLGQVANLLLAG